MANVLIEESVLQGWADTIREKTGAIDAMLPTVMLTKTQEEWGASSGGGETVTLQDKTFTENGTYTADAGYTGLGTVVVDVASSGGDGEVDPVTTNFINLFNRTGDEITLPEGITQIPDDMFYNYQSLKHINLPDSLQRIGGYAFTYSGLKELIIPQNVRTIDHYGLSDTEFMQSVTFRGKPAGSISDTAFYSCESLRTVNVPWAEGEVANAPWGANNATINYNYTGV